MAINATFNADFGNLEQNAQRAEQVLRDFGLEPDRVAQKLERLSNAYEGRKVIADAIASANAVELIGGASKLSEAELQRLGTQAQVAVDKLRLMGKDAPQNLLDLAAAAKRPTDAMAFLQSSIVQVASAVGLTFSAGAIIGAIGRTVEWASRVENLSETLGLSIETVQRYDFAASKNETTIDAVSRSMVLLSKNLENNSAGFQKLGLDTARLRDLSPEELFRKVGAAISALPDKTQQLAVAQQLLGRSGTELLPMLRNLEQDLKDAAVATDDTIKAAGKLGDTWDKLKQSGSVLLASVLGPIAPEAEKAAQFVGFLATKMQQLGELRKAAGESAISVSPQGAAAGVLDSFLANFGIGARASAELAQQIQVVTTQAAAGAKGLNEYQQAERFVGLSADEAVAASGRLDQQLKATNQELGLQSRLIGEDTVTRATALLAALDGLAARGMKPTAAGAAEVVQAMTAARQVLEETGRAGEATATRMEQVRRQFAGLNEDGTLKSTSLPVYLQTAPIVAVDEATKTLLITTQERIAAEESFADAYRESMELADANAKMVEDGLKAQVAATAEVRAGFDGMTASANQAAAAIAVMIPLGTSLKQAYIDSGLFVNDAASPIQAPGVRRSRSAGDILRGFAGGTDGYEYFGSGTPVMLHGWEKVTPKGRGGDGTVVNVNISVPGGMATAPAEQAAQARRLGDALVGRMRSLGYAV